MVGLVPTYLFANMADFDRQSLDFTSSSPKQPENEMSLGSPLNPEPENGASASASASAPVAENGDGQGQGPGSPTDSPETYPQKQVKEVLASDV